MNKTERRERILLAEYESCQRTTERLESVIWKTSGFTALGSVSVSLGFLFETINPSIGIAQKATFAIFIVVLLFIWREISRRWHNIQILTFYRMKHIEVELDMFQVRYVFHKDRFAHKDNLFLKKRQTINTEERTSLNKFMKENKFIEEIDTWKENFYKYDVMKWMDRLLEIVSVFFIILLASAYFATYV